MKDYRASIEKLRKDAAEAALIRDLATDPGKRELYDRLHRHFNRLANEVEQAINSRAAEQSKAASVRRTRMRSLQKRPAIRDGDLAQSNPTID